MNYDVIEVKPIDHLLLRVKFRDGLSGEVILRESHLSGVFEPLKDPDIFSKANCENGFVEWPGDIDLAPDAMYEEVKRNGVWKLS
ncbi:MAG: DUF2442 domain-containing protein [Chitinivibrionales bacterium]